MTESLNSALDRARDLLLKRDGLVRAVASGRRRGQRPRWEKTQLRPVMLKTGIALQISRFDGQRPEVSNVNFADAAEALSTLLAEPYANWHIETTDRTFQMRVTKRGEALVHESPAARTQDLQHDRTPPHLIPADDPLFSVLGAKAAKRRQVDAFLRAVAPVLPDTDERALRVTDLGCGNAYLTFALHRYFARTDRDAKIVGVDVRKDQRERNSALAVRLECAEDVTFIAGTIADAPLPDIDMVLALHACDTATDDALARGVRLGAKYIVAAPCCHHDVAAQLRRSSGPPGYGPMLADGILRERFAEVLTDSLRAAILRLQGYRVDVIEFIDSQHTPKNTLLRAQYTGAAASESRWREYRQLVSQWELTPKLAKLLDMPTRA